MSFFDTLKQYGLWPQQQQGQPQQQPYGLDPEMVRQARMQSLSNLGGQILAASMKQTDAQRANLMSNMDRTGGYNTNLYNAAQMTLMADRQKQAQIKQQRTDQVQQRLAEVIRRTPPGQRRDAAMFFLQSGDLNKAGELLFGAQDQAKPPEMKTVRVGDKEVTYQWDPTQQRWVKFGEGYAFKPDAPQDGAPNPSDVRAAAKDYYTSPEYTTFTNLSTSLGSLRESIDKPDKVADLDFVYAAANALDPGSVVREGDYLQIVRTQGLSGELIATINQVAGGQGLSRETREKLYRLIQGRANEWGKAATRRREAVLRYSGGILTPEMLDMPGQIPGLPSLVPDPNTTAPGRTDRLDALPEPELLRVE